MKDSKTALIHHISRLEGQLASVKKELMAAEPNCEKAALTLKASARSFSSLRLAFVSCFMEKNYLSAKHTSDPAYQALLQVINS